MMNEFNEGMTRRQVKLAKREARSEAAVQQRLAEASGNPQLKTGSSIDLALGGEALSMLGRSAVSPLSSSARSGSTPKRLWSPIRSTLDVRYDPIVSNQLIDVFKLKILSQGRICTILQLTQDSWDLSSSLPVDDRNKARLATLLTSNYRSAGSVASKITALSTCFCISNFVERLIYRIY